jgi:hypothetical protein
MDEEKAVRIVLSLDISQDRGAPESSWGQPFIYDLADLRTARVRASSTFDRRIVCATELLLGMPNSAAISL